MMHPPILDLFYHGKFHLNNQTLFFTVLGSLFLLLSLLTFQKSNTNGSPILRREFTESLRGLSILIIITHHLSHNLETPQELAVFHHLGHFGVGIFLLLSGFGLGESYKSKGIHSFFYPKVLKIVLPFVLVNIMIVVLNKTIGEGSIPLTDIPFCIMGRIIYDANFWYMQFLFYLYFAFWLVFRMSLSKNHSLIVLLLLSLVVMVSDVFPVSARINSLTFWTGACIALKKEEMEAYVDGGKWKVLLLLFGIWIALFCFKSLIFSYPGSSRKLIFLLVIIGTALGLKNSSFPIKEKWGLFLFTLLGTAYISLSPSLPTYVIEAPLVVTQVLFVICVLFYLFRSLNSGFLLFIGGISFELYLLHGSFLVNYDFILHKWPIEYSYVLYLIFMILFAYFFKKISNGLANYLDTIGNKWLK